MNTESSIKTALQPSPLLAVAAVAFPHTMRLAQQSMHRSSSILAGGRTAARQWHWARAAASSQTAASSNAALPTQQQSSSSPEVPSILELLSTHGARLTTAAQMVWAQVLQPGDVAVDATCGNGHDSLFMAQCIGSTGHLHAVDLQVRPSAYQHHTKTGAQLCSLDRAAPHWSRTPA